MELDILGEEMVLMCYVKDTRVLNGICTFDEVVEKFGEPLIKKMMIEENLIGYCKYNSDSLDWTELGWRAMGV